MSEVRGYPNPNYTEDDIMTEEEMEELGMVYVDLEHYEELVSKAAKFDILAENIHSTGRVDDDVVRAVVNVTPEEAVQKLSGEKDRAWNAYWQEFERSKELREKLALAEDQLNALQPTDWPPKDEEVKPFE